MKTKMIKHRAISRTHQSTNGEFLFRRHRRGPALQSTDDFGRISRSKVSEK